MVLRMMEGFETKQIVSTKLDTAYTLTGVIGATAPGRKAGTAMNAQTLTLLSKELVSPDENTWIVGFAVQKPTDAVVGASATAGFELHNASGAQCSLVMVPGDNGAYKWELRRDVTVIDTSASAFVPGNPKSWMYFQLKVTVRTSTNGSYELRSYDYDNNATVEMSGTLVNLAHQAVDGADRVKFYWEMDAAASVVFDDIVVLDSTGAFNNDFMTPPPVVLGSLPDADGNQSDWTPSSGVDHYLLVDDPANDLSDVGKVTAQVVSDVDLFTYADFPEIHTSGTAIIGAQIISTAAMVASGTRTLRVRVRESAAEATGANFVVNDLILDAFRQMFDQNPTGVPATWTKTTLEAAEFGIEIQA
jgi:hypothetical protein